MFQNQQKELISLPGRNGLVLHTIISTSTSEHATSHPTLVLLHYWGGTNRTFNLLISQLQDQFNIIAPSFRGWGQSTKTFDTYYVKDFADDIADLIAYLGEARPELVTHGVVFVGHSEGGKVSQLLLAYPDMKSLIKGLVLIASAPARKFQLPTAEMIEQQIHAYDSAESAHFVMENVLLGTPQPDDVVSKLVEDAIGGSATAKAAWPGYGMAEDYGDAVVDAVRTNWKALQVLAFIGSLDKIEPEERVRKEVVELLEGAGAVVTVKKLKAGHIMPVEVPEGLAKAIVEFLN